MNEYGNSVPPEDRILRKKPYVDVDHAGLTGDYVAPPVDEGSEDVGVIIRSNGERIEVRPSGLSQNKENPSGFFEALVRKFGKRK